MPPVAADFGPARLRLAAEAAKREALSLASEWGTPLIRVRPGLAEAFQGPFGEAAVAAISGWEGGLGELGNQLFRLHNACEAAADEEEAIARAVAAGFPPMSRYQDLSAALVAWERRLRQRRPFVPPQGRGAGGYVAINTERVRSVAKTLGDVCGDFEASYRRLTVPFREIRLEAPEELSWVVEDCGRLAQELRRRTDAVDAADAQVRHSAVTALSLSFSGLLAAPGPVTAAATRPGPGKRASADAKQLMEDLRPGFFDVAGSGNGRKMLAEAERVSEKDPRYAAAFLRALGLANLRWLIENGQLDPCVLGALVARASQAGVGVDFLTKTLGTDRFDAPRRAALLSACPGPEALFHPAWVERMTVTLLTGRDPPGKGDPRRWYREAAANLLSNHPAGAIRFINRHQELACRALFSHDDTGGRAAQAGVDDMLLNPAKGMEKAAEDALERVVVCAANHEFKPEGKQALARLLARPETLENVALQLTGSETPARPGERGFGVAQDRLQTVLSQLMVDGEARRTLLDSANRFAAQNLKSLLADPAGPSGADGLKEVGAIFGALGSRSYSIEAALDVQGLAGDTARSLVEGVGGTVLELATAHPVVSLVVKGGSAILFDVGEASAEQERLARELEVELKGAEARERLKGDLVRNMEHLTYVSVLVDPDERAALGLRLSPDDLPAEVPADLNLTVASREEWARDLFDDQGRLIVPTPADNARWRSFIGWTKAVNPELRDRVSGLTDPMFDAFDLVRRA